MQATFKYFLIIICILILIVCARCFKRKQARIDFNKPIQTQLMQSGKMKPVVLKQVSGLLQHTDFVGTPEQPTIDGGIVNAADGLVVTSLAIDDRRDDRKNTATLPIKRIEKIENREQKLQPEISGAFQDQWATSKRVKQLLQTAAQEGKLDYVLRKIDEKGLPASLATVPMIESNYQAFSTSNKGAAGLWQLMPSIAKDYGISSLDRYHFQLSTTIALDLLNRLHQQFGSWALAFAAYNAGSKRVELSLHKNPKARSIKDLDLPKETKQYVSRIMSINKKLDKVLL